MTLITRKQIETHAIGHVRVNQGKVTIETNI